MAKKQNKPLLRSWIKSLRSGVRKQTRDTLHRRYADAELPAGYCCLGDLSVVIGGKKTIAGWRWNGEAWKNKKQKDFNDWTIPDAVLEALNLHIDQERLTRFNDKGHWGFPRIANWLEKKYLKA